MLSARRWLYRVLEEEQVGFFSKLINLALILLIVSNVIAIVLASEISIYTHFKSFFFIFERVALVIFTIEYCIRLWVSIEKYPNAKKHPLYSRLRYALTPMALIDLLAILPSYLLLFGSDLLILRALRLVRVFKLTRYSSSMELLITVCKQEAEKILSAIFVLTILIVISAAGIYLVEGTIQPDQFGSIPRALWWATVTLTTVGYGDAVPITLLGKIFGIIIVITGIGMAALPAGILASGFSSEVSKRRERFKMAILRWIDEGTFNHYEKKELVALRLKLGVSRADAALIIREVRREVNLLKRARCPRCGEAINRY